MRFILVFLLFATWLIITNCNLTTSKPNETEPPVTTMANVPVEGDTLFPIVTFHWDGGDSDGFVKGFEYRYTTTFLTSMDSVTTDWFFTENTSETITFLSNDNLNKQRLEVRAIDNEDKVDPSPTVRTIYTPQTFSPTTEIIAPLNGEQRFAQSTSTDWWPGIQLAFTGSDKDGEIEEYGWSIDGSDFEWTKDTTVTITPDYFESPISGEHTIVVTSKDDTGLEDQSPDTAIISLVEPSFGKKLIVLDDTDESNWQSGVDFSDAQVDSFYTFITSSLSESQITFWDFSENGMPSREILGNHKLMLWHADDRTTTDNIPISDNKELLSDYANVGGDLFISGWAIIKSLANRQSFPREFPEDDFVNTYLHINEASETQFLADFTEAIGVGGYQDISVDTSKLANDFRSSDGGIYRVNLIDQRGAFTDALYSYGASDDTNYPEYRGQTCAVIYYGTSFRSVVLGFPLFFMDKEDTKEFFDQVLIELDY